jgi:SEC-C motif-containing protein
MNTCPCGTELTYEECCGPIIDGTQNASSAEQLMRSRYTAYAKQDIGYILSSLHPKHREGFDEKGTRQWAKNSQWQNLEIVNTSGGGEDDTEGFVEFIATYTEGGAKKEHHEVASFKKDDGKWYFVDGNPVSPGTVVREGPKVGRNDPCTCGSGKKFKKCCG